MKILFFTNDSTDYLEDALLIGFKQIKELEVTEVKIKKIVYKIPNQVKNIRGGGFTLYNLLDFNTAIETNCDISKPYLDSFDLVIFSSIQRQFGYFYQYYNLLNPSKTLLFDGEDVPNLLGYSGNYWRCFLYWFIPKAHKKFTYYKREITPRTWFYRYYMLLPEFIVSKFKLPNNVKPISFAIPQEKIVTGIPLKTKPFPVHIVDEELVDKIENAQSKYAFDSEDTYYDDLKKSKYGITTKRAGWDCLRHYEIAANAAIICFRELEKKPILCAPHDLVPGINCISYNNYNDLMKKINSISDEEYLTLQKNSLDWVKSKTCENIARQILKF